MGVADFFALAIMEVQMSPTILEDWSGGGELKRDDREEGTLQPTGAGTEAIFSLTHLSFILIQENFKDRTNVKRAAQTSCLTDTP